MGLTDLKMGEEDGLVADRRDCESEGFVYIKQNEKNCSFHSLAMPLNSLNELPHFSCRYFKTRGEKISPTEI